MQPLKLFKTPSVFFISMMSLIFVLLAVSSLRHSAVYVQFFDVVILSFALLFLAWSVFLWWHRIKGTREEKFFARRLRHFLLLCIVAPFIYVFLVVGEDLAARRLPIYKSGLEQTDSSEAAAKILGRSTTIGWPVNLAGEVSSDSGHAELSIPLVGGTKKAELHVDGIKDNGAWSIKNLYLVQAGTNEQIPIAASPSPEQPLK